MIDIKGIKLGSYNIVVGLASDKVEHVSGEKEVNNNMYLLFHTNATQGITGG